jgi:hypothetical protein
VKLMNVVRKHVAPIRSVILRACAVVTCVFASATLSLAQGPTLPAGGYTPEELTTVGGLAATRWGTFLAVGLLFMIAVGIVKKGVGMLIGIFGARRARV